MRIATTASIALLALSTAALAQVASSPTGPQTTQNNMMSSNTMMPDTTLNNSATPDNGTTLDNGTTPPGE